MILVRTQRHPGFTFFQLLLLLVLLAMVLAFLAPAVVRLRQVAVQTSSVNNMRQLGIASHNFHDTHAKLPPAIGKVAQTEGTAHFFLLPFLEQDSLYRKATKGPWQNNVYSTPVNVFLSPDDKQAPPDNLYKGWLATTNYPANWLTFKDGTIRLADITDGTSNTFLFGQRYQMCRSTPCAWGYNQLYYWAPIFAYYSQAKFQNAPTQETCDPTLAQSLNSSRIQICFADGSVRAIGHHVNAQSWWYGCHPSDGNTLELDE
jgi:type II secretory pathway pseudopilin PulG